MNKKDGPSHEAEVQGYSDGVSVGDVHWPPASSKCPLLPFVPIVALLLHHLIQSWWKIDSLLGRHREEAHPQSGMHLAIKQVYNLLITLREGQYSAQHSAPLMSAHCHYYYYYSPIVSFLWATVVFSNLSLGLQGKIGISML
jgi:hypothetical protein